MIATPCDLDRLEAVVLGELTSREAAAVRAHAAGCADCGQELALLQSTRAALAGPARRTPERISHLYPAIAVRVAARKSVRRQLSAMALTFASLCAVVFVSTAGERSRAVHAVIDSCGLQCREPAICEMPNDEDEISALEQKFMACLIATPSQWP